MDFFVGLYFWSSIFFSISLYFNSQGNLTLHICLSKSINYAWGFENRNNSKKGPFVTKENFFSDFTLILCAKPFDHKEFKIFFFKICFFFKKIFFNLQLCSRPPKNFGVKNFNSFWKKMLEIALLGQGKYQREQSHELWWTLSLFYRCGKWIHGRAGQKDPSTHTVLTFGCSPAKNCRGLSETMSKSIFGPNLIIFWYLE